MHCASLEDLRERLIGRVYQSRERPDAQVGAEA
jgi:hypothetical protein